MRQECRNWFSITLCFYFAGRNEIAREASRNEVETENKTVKSFTFRELATATKNFRQETLLGEGGYGKVFKGTLGATGEV